MSKYIVGIDLGGTVTKIGIFNFQDKILRTKFFATNKDLTKNALIHNICSKVNEIITEARLKKNQIKAIGVGFPGPVDTKKGYIYYLPNIPGWKNTPIKKILQKRLALPVFVDNDVKLMTLAELIYGAAKDTKNSVCMTLGTGIGGGIIIDGKLYRGSDLIAGEIGHIPVQYGGRKCNCGGKGCLESYAGNKPIYKLAKEYFGADITLEKLEFKAKQGNRKALAIWQEIGKIIGFALVGVVNLLNPECIVIGGGVARVGNILLGSIRKTIKENAMMVQAKTVKILRSKLGYNSGLIGAAVFARISLEGGSK